MLLELDPRTPLYKDGLEGEGLVSCAELEGAGLTLIAERAGLARCAHAQWVVLLVTLPERTFEVLGTVPFEDTTHSVSL